MTKIEWCDITINPVVGCSKCSPGCDNCYAERFAARLAKNPATARKYAGVVDEHGKWTGKVSALDLSCFHKRPDTPKRVFVGSMTDLFHPEVSFEDLRHIWKQMSFLAQHTFLVLTKRPDRMVAFCEDAVNASDPLPNLWLGVTVCNQAEADAKIPLLLQTPAAKRFVSIEPMLGPVDLTTIRHPNAQGYIYSANAFTGLWSREKHHSESQDDYLSSQAAMHERLPALDWVICGGETGSKARPMHPDWARSLRDQCQAAGVPFFFKGWGEWLPASRDEYNMWSTPHQGYLAYDMPHGQLPGPCGNSGCWEPEKLEAHGCAYIVRVGKKRAGRLLDGREWNEVPQ